MTRYVLRAKIHRATVTAADLDYEGSISIDRGLMDEVDIAAWEQVHVVDLTNGSRLETYVIEAPRGSGEIQVNGAAAHLVRPGDLVIVMAYGGVPEERLAEHRPRIVMVDERNRVRWRGPEEARPAPAAAARAAAGGVGA